MEVYEAGSYRAFVEHCLHEGTAHRPRSTNKEVARHLRCHGTFISHVVAGKAEFSNEQAVRFCDFFGLDTEATDHFLDMVCRDRAGDRQTRELFDRRLEAQRGAWLTLRQRLKDERRLSGEQQRLYFESWLLQLVHLACMIPGQNTLAGVTALLGLPEVRIEGALRQLTGMGILSAAGGAYTPQPRRLHLDRGSPSFRTCHGNWRVKIAADVAAVREPAGIHYTSAMTISRAAATGLRKAILDQIEAARDVAVNSSPEVLQVLAIDFYPVGPQEPEADPPAADGG